MNVACVEQLRRFYESNRQELFSYSLVVTHNREAAEDAIHNAFQRLLRRGSVPDDLRPYVFRCVRNAAMDDHRQGKRREESIFALEPDNCQSPNLELRAELDR